MTEPTYADWVLVDRPRWLSGLRDGWGERWLRSLGSVVDLVVEGAIEALRAGMVSRSPDDAVTCHAGERDLEQYDGETVDAWRTRIAGAWDEWEMAGREDGVRRNVARALQAQLPGFDAVDVYEQWDWGTVDGTQASRVWLILGDGVADLPWEPTVLGPDLILGDGWTLGSTATRAEVLEVARVFRKWKSGHSYAMGIILVQPGDTLPDPYDYTLTNWRMGKVLGWANLTLGSYTLGGYAIP